MKMKKVLLILSMICSGSLWCKAVDPDIIITQEGESLKVYNLELSSNSVFYTLQEGTDANVEKISKNNVLLIKKADGTILNLSDGDSGFNHKARKEMKNPDADEAVTYVATSDFFQDKKGNQMISEEDNKGQKILFRLIPNEEKTLAVTKWQDKGKYDGEEYVLPDYVRKDNDTYTVKYIDDKAFYLGRAIDSRRLKRIVFPTTLKKIGSNTFHGQFCLTTIILPENLENIGDKAFYTCGAKMIWRRYIPKGVKTIGLETFRGAGLSKIFKDI